MDAKQLTTGTVVGGITMFVLGFLIFQQAFGDFYASNAGSAAGVARDEVIWLANVAGAFFLAALVTLTVGWSGASSAGAGFKVGGTVGFLVWGGVQLLFYSGTHLSNFTIVIVDPLLEIVRTGAVGAVVAITLAKAAGAEEESVPAL